MSSFRIDRQYVSFVSAETDSVLVSDEPDVKETAPPAPRENFDAAIQKGAEILEQARLEANVQGELILKQAQSEADAIIRKAKETAERFIQDADSRASVIQESAKKEGYSEGKRLAAEENTERKRTEAETFQLLEEKLRRNYENLVDGMQEDILALVMDIVRKVIQVKVKEDKVILGFLENALEQLKQAGSLTIHVGLEDYARYFGEEGAEQYRIAENAKITIVEEESYNSGDLLVESEGEVLDYRIGKQLERIESAFQQEGD